MPEAPRPPLAVIVPVYRNAPTLEALAGRVRAALAGPAPGYRLLLVIDASPDASAEVAARLAARDPACAALVLPRNVGQHRALLAGLAAVEAEAYAVLDADLQDPPELLPELLAAARRCGGSAFAVRRGRYQPWHRMLTSRVFKTLLGLLTGLPAGAGSYLLFPREVRDELLRLSLPTPQVVVMARRRSRAWCAVPYRRARRPEGASAYSAASRLRAAGRAWRCAWALRGRWPRR